MKTYLSLFTMLLCLLSSQLGYAAQELVPQAKEDMKHGRYTLAIEKLSQAITNQSNDYEAWFLFGVAHSHELQYQQAIEAFRQVITLRPDLAEPHNNLAAVYNALGDPKAAVRELEAALIKRPHYAVADENIANLYIELALRHYRSSLEQSSSPVVEQRYARLLKVRNPIQDAPKAVVEESKKDSEPSQQAKKPEQTKPPKLAKPLLPTAPSPEQSDVGNSPAVVVTNASPRPEKEVDPGITGVLDALESWRLAWSAQSLAGYFAAYSAEYKPEARFSSVKAWKKCKTRVIKNKKYIKVGFEQVNVDMQPDSDVATVMMLQRFRSNSYNGDGFKRINLRRGHDGWKIISEVSVK
ncbi:MAG: tetratricopeptide repeat protein [Ghiorsea sp.]